MSGQELKKFEVEIMEDSLLTFSQAQRFMGRWLSNATQNQLYRDIVMSSGVNFSTSVYKQDSFYQGFLGFNKIIMIPRIDIILLLYIIIIK